MANSFVDHLLEGLLFFFFFLQSIFWYSFISGVCLHIESTTSFYILFSSNETENKKKKQTNIQCNKMFLSIYVNCKERNKMEQENFDCNRNKHMITHYTLHCDLLLTWKLKRKSLFNPIIHQNRSSDDYIIVIIIVYYYYCF